MATVAASTRLADWLEQEVRTFWEEHGEGSSVGLRRVVEEWWALQHFPALEFREGVSGRRAGLRGGPDVWEVVMVARDYSDDLDELTAHFGGRISPDALQQVIAYVEWFAEEVNGWIDENGRIGRKVADPPEAR
jgi:hypothetical protein